MIRKTKLKKMYNEALNLGYQGLSKFELEWYDEGSHDKLENAFEFLWEITGRLNHFATDKKILFDAMNYIKQYKEGKKFSEIYEEIDDEWRFTYNLIIENDYRTIMRLIDWN